MKADEAESNDCRFGGHFHFILRNTQVVLTVMRIIRCEVLYITSDQHLVFGLSYQPPSRADIR